MLTLAFEGFFQCRLATDPDPADEPRGVSGWTFAVAPEPDLDRVIRLQDPLAPRSHGPTVGVTVRRVSLNGQPLPDHPLRGARVNLLDNPKFEGRSGIVAEDALEPIDPFVLEISGGGLTLRREDFWNRRNPRRVRIVAVPPVLLARRQPIPDEAPTEAEIMDAIGAGSVPELARERRRLLEEDLAAASDPVARAALRTRIAAIRFLPIGLFYRFEINGPGAVAQDEGGLLDGTVSTAPPWPIGFWMGGFDADALCGYVRGSLELPFRATSA